MRRAAATAAVAIVVALVAARRLVLIDSSSNETLGLLQELFGAQIALATLIGTGISIAVEFRSRRFGSEVLFNLVSSRRLLASTIAVIASIGVTGAVLGNWRALGAVRGGLIPDLAVLLVVISTCALLASAMSGIRTLTDDESVARHIARATRRTSWRRDIQQSWEARPVPWLLEALRAAQSNGDIHLFARLITSWVREISEAAPYVEIRKEAGSVVLSGEDTHYMVALDNAHHELFLGLSVATEPRSEFSRQLQMLAELAFPAFSSESEYHLRPPRPFAAVRPVSYQTVIPGLHTLGEMTSRAIATRDFELASTLIRRYWGPAAAAAIRLSERIVDWNHFEVSDRALTDSVRHILRRYAEVSSGSGPNAVKHAVSVAVLTTLDEAESSRVLSDFAGEFGNSVRDVNIEDSFGDEIGRPWMWQLLLRVAEKEHAPVMPLCYIARDVVRRSGEPLNFFKFDRVRDEILLYLHGVLRAINRIESYRFMEESMVQWLWKYLERHHTRMPSKLMLSSLDEGPFLPGFQERYDLSSEALTETGREALGALRDAFLVRYANAESAGTP